MSDKTGISWTDATWNPIVGCTKVSAGCDNCYAIRTAHRMAANPNPLVSQAYAGTESGGEWTGKVNLLADRLEPLRWRKPRRIFVNAQSDLFHKGVPDEFIARVFAVMALTPRHTYQVLTKRHGRMRSLLRSDNFRPAVEDAMRGIVAAYRTERPWYAAWPLPNLWLGVSVEDQATADLRIPALLDTPAAVRWLSCEPLLGPVDLRGLLQCFHCKTTHKFELCDRMSHPVPYGALSKRHVDWVVVGGESGPGARPMHPAWARSLRDQCQAAGVPFHFKQAGSVLAREWGCTGKGTDPDEWPESFPREYPNA